MTANTPEEMRREMEEEAAYGMPSWDAGKPRVDFTSATVRACLISARRDGWSGEDTYTLLAYHMRHLAQQFGDAQYKSMVMAPPRPIAFEEPPRWRMLLQRSCDCLKADTVQGGVAKGKPVHASLIAEIERALEWPNARKT